MLGIGFQSLGLAYETGREYYKAVKCRRDCLFDMHHCFHAVHFAPSKHNSVLAGITFCPLPAAASLLCLWVTLPSFRLGSNKALTKHQTAKANKRKKKRRHGNAMSKIVLYDRKNMGHWELLVRTICFKRSYGSGNNFRKALLLPCVSADCAWCMDEEDSASLRI